MPLFAFAQTTLPTCNISATPNSVLVGSTVTVRWSSTNADTGTITRIGAVGPQGQLDIQPSTAGELVFAGTFTGPGGTATCQTSVVVNRVTTTGGNNTSSGGSGSTQNSSYTSGSYTSGSYSTGDPYSINPANYQTQPSSNQFAGNQQTVSSGSGGSGGVSNFLVPCGLSSDPLSATSCNICGFGQLIQNIINFLIIISIPLSAALFAWAGIMLFTSTYKPEGIKKAKGIFRNVVIGLIIALSGYLIVQTLLNALMNQAFFTNGWSWNSLQCNDYRPRTDSVSSIFTNLFLPSGTAPTVANQPVPGGVYSTAQCANSVCSPVTLNQMGYSQAQANVMACIAMTESSGDPTRVNPKSSACGTFQILPSNWRNAKLHQDGCSSATSCTDAYCNAQSAYLLSQGRVRAGQSAYADWTCPGCNSRAAACVQKYDPNG